MAELVNPSYTDFTIETLTQPSGIERLNSILRQLSNNIAGDTENVRIYQGYGTPEAAVAAGIGSLYMRLDGTTDTSVYRKESGSGDTGWVAIKAPASLPLSVANGGFGADNSSQVQGTIPYVSATGVISFLGTSTSGYFLKTQGAGANPAWAALPTPALSLVSTTTFTTATNTGDITISSGELYYAKVVFTLASAPMTFKFNNDATGNSYGYVYQGRAFSSATETLGNSNWAATSITTGSTNLGNYAQMDINIYPKATAPCIEGTIAEAHSAGSHQFTRFAGGWNAGTPTSFRLESTNNMTGTVYLYKYSKT